MTPVTGETNPHNASSRFLQQSQVPQTLFVTLEVTCTVHFSTFSPSSAPWGGTHRRHWPLPLGLEPPSWSYFLPPSLLYTSRPKASRSCMGSFRRSNGRSWFLLFIWRMAFGLEGTVSKLIMWTTRVKATCNMLWNKHQSRQLKFVLIPTESQILLLYGNMPFCPQNHCDVPDQEAEASLGSPVQSSTTYFT